MCEATDDTIQGRGSNSIDYSRLYWVENGLKINDIICEQSLNSLNDVVSILLVYELEAPPLFV